MMKERIYVIYALVDPRDESVRYIGITDNMPTRFIHHLRETGSRTAKGTWLAELRRYGLQPTIKILEEMRVKQTQRYLVEERERSEEHTSELQSHSDLVCRLLLEKKK